MGQEPEGTSGQAPQTAQGATAPVQPAQAATGQDPATSSEGEMDRIRRELAAARQEAAANRVKLKEYEQSQMTELEKARTEAKEATEKLSAHETRLREANLRLEVERTARKLGIIDEDAAFKLIDPRTLTYDENGNVIGAEAALDDLVKQRPWLTGPGATGANAGRPANPTRQAMMGGFTQEQLNDPVFYQQHRAEILAAFKAGRITQ